MIKMVLEKLQNGENDGEVWDFLVEEEGACGRDVNCSLGC
jgi:cytochrome c-type biogenesis protein CcmH/NrfF